MTERGRFVVLEGVEGAGKSTQIGLLAEWLEGAGLAVTAVREPGGTPVGEAIREVLLDRMELHIPAATELLLILAARAALVRDVVRPALERGEIVLADRFDLSTFAYQGYGRGIDLAEVRRLNAFATGGLRPDLYLVLDVPAEIGLTRQRQDGKVEDRIEGGGAGFLRAVREGYLDLARLEPAAAVVDATGGAGAVQLRLRQALAERFPETIPSPAV